MPSTQSRKTEQDYVGPPRIETELEYELAIERVEELWDAKDGTPEAEARDALCAMIEDYECRYEDLG